MLISVNYDIPTANLHGLLTDSKTMSLDIGPTPWGDRPLGQKVVGAMQGNFVMSVLETVK